MNKLISIGECLIDFTATSPGSIASVSGFDKNAGGAPANVAVCVARLGGQSSFISKLGNDGFGDFLIETLKNKGVDCSKIIRDAFHHTPLAFVSLTESGERDFMFLRKHSSDLFLTPDEIDESMFINGDILHFGSVDLVSEPVKSAHLTAIKYAIKNHLVELF